MTIVELLWVTLLIGGGAAGAMAGHAWFGLWGGVGGLAAGIGVGLMVCCTIACFLNALVPRRAPDESSRIRTDMTAPEHNHGLHWTRR